MSNLLSTNLDQEKKNAASAAVETIKDGMVVGLGSGSTAEFAIRMLGERVTKGLTITGIPTSEGSRIIAQEVGIALTDLTSDPVVDVTIDGTDRFNDNLDLIKGGGGALLREKIVASASKKLVIIAESTKHTNPLSGFPLPIEVIKFGLKTVMHHLESLNLQPMLRARKDNSNEPFLTDEGNFIVDLQLETIEDPKTLAEQLIYPGIVEHGLFLGLASEVYLGVGGDVVRFPK